MTSPGLNNRLRQHGRRAGVMVGLSMALTIAVCIGAFTWIYLQVDPLTRDFVNAATAAPTKKPTVVAKQGATAAPTSAPSESGNQVTQIPPTQTVVPAQTATSSAFTPTHRVAATADGTNVNLRPGPAVASGDPVGQLASGTEVQYLNETKDSEDPDAQPGVQWMKVRTADGTEGWIRADFLEPIGG